LYAAAVWSCAAGRTQEWRFVVHVWKDTEGVVLARREKGVNDAEIDKQEDNAGRKEKARSDAHAADQGPRAKHGGNGILKDVALFSSLADKELQQIRTHIILRDFKKNQTILHEEETSEFMYIIISGKVKISRVGRNGKEAILSMHGSGEFFGELSLIDGRTSPASVLAVENSNVAIISKDHFYSLLYTQRKILENLLKILCSRLRDAWQKIEMLNFNDASQRLKMLLNMLSETYGEKTPKGTVLRVRLIHQDLADMTGLTRETVTRVLDRWKKSGEIEVLSSKFIRLNDEFQSIQL
jgi:CRP/FNR family transcriptional regulator